MKNIALVVAFVAMLLLILVPVEQAKALSPAVVYNENQLVACSPHPVSDNDFADDKVHMSGKSVTAVSEVLAPEGRIFDPRPEAIAFEAWALNSKGHASRPVASARLMDMYVTAYRLSTKDGRRGSYKLAKSIEAKNAMSVLAAQACIVALGLHNIESMGS